MKVDNAIILAAGTGQRFVPLSAERHKALTIVKGEVLIERQIKQLLEAGIQDIYIVVGYKAEQFIYLCDRYGVKLINNPEYYIRNNSSSIWYAKDVLKNSYICSSDNYYEKNLFSSEEKEPFYTAQYSKQYIDEWCMEEDCEGNICKVCVGGHNSWYMLGHAFWDAQFSNRFMECLRNDYYRPDTYNKLWESIMVDHLDVLKMRVKKYSSPCIHEFDSLDELRLFDTSYYDDSRSCYIKAVCEQLGVKEKDIVNFIPIDESSQPMTGFEFTYNRNQYRYYYRSGKLIRIK